MLNWRTLCIGLVLANLLLFAWDQGYFGAREDGREPQRPGQQLQADKLRVVAATLPGVKPPADACRAIDGLAPEEAQALRSAAQEKAPQLKFVVRPVEEVSSYWVLIPALADRSVAEKKMAELKGLGVSGYQLIEGAPGEKLALVLGAFKTEAAASDFLQRLNRRGVRSARVQAREKTVLKVQMAVYGKADSLDDKLRGLLQAFPLAAASPCAKEGP